jgi:excisionase family DNA binding protein
MTDFNSAVTDPEVPSRPALLTPKEVAEVYGLSRRRIYDWLGKGWLRGHRRGGRWVVTAQDLDLFTRTCIGKRGRPMPSLYEWEPIWKATETNT